MNRMQLLVRLSGQSFEVFNMRLACECVYSDNLMRC